MSEANMLPTLKPTVVAMSAYHALFLDTEFTDFEGCELISIGMVSEDARHDFYREIEDFDRLKCNAFVRETVWTLLGRDGAITISKVELALHLKEWFYTLPRQVTIACDSSYDRRLLSDILENEWPKNFAGWFDLRPLIDTSVFDKAVAAYHTVERPWHHALYDAHAHRAGWLAWMAEKSRSHSGDGS